MRHPARCSSWSAWWSSGSRASPSVSASRSTSSCGRGRGCRKRPSTSGIAKPADLRRRGEPAVDRLDLPAGVLTAPAVVDNEVGPGALLVEWHLRSDPLTGLVDGEPVTFVEPAELRL